MKKVLQLGLFLCFCVAANAQRDYFIYLQSETSTPFYVKLNDKIISSSSTGYVILPQLRDSTYSFSIGNSGNRNSEAKFSVPINNTDKGFLVKNYQDELSLFDLQTMAIVKPVGQQSRNSDAVVKKDDAFTKLLAQAADDSSLLVQPIIAKKEAPAKVEEKKAEPKTEIAKSETETVKPVIDNTSSSTTNSVANVDQKNDVKKEEPKKVEAEIKEEPKKEESKKEEVAKIEEVKKEETKAEETKNESVGETKKEITETETPKKEEPKEVKPVEYKRSVVSRRSESSTTEGFGLVFLDNDGGDIDTIKILIPNPKTTIKSEPEQKQSDVKFLDISTNTDKTTSDNKQPQLSKAECEDIATDNDFKKLRRNMASEDTDEKMMDAAKKSFRKQCYTTEQIKNLSTLFLTNYGKYNFLELAYSYVSDRSQYASLVSELSDEAYKTRFKKITAGEL